VDADTVTAICAVAIAVASLAVSVTETRATRAHNRQSVRPLLGFECHRWEGGEAGIRLRNSGLGPAIITSTRLIVDGKPVGPWEAYVVNSLRDSLDVRPVFLSLRVGKSFPVGFDKMILSIGDYYRERDVEFWNLICSRMKIEVEYESLYGDERFEAIFEGPYDAGSE